MSSSESEDNYDNPEKTEDLDDGERTAIRSELSSLSFEELQKLKERIGAKVYKEAIFGKKDGKIESVKPKVFKRENKNRPREMSAKKPVSMMIDVPKLRKKEIRDPRFDPLCGEFNKKQFADDYNFLTEMRMNDIKATRAELRQTTDPEKALKLRRLLQRLNEQHKASRMKKTERMEMEKQKKQAEKEVREGKQPYYKNKSEKRVEALVSQFEELRKEGATRVQRHIKRRQQKVKRRSHKAPTGVS
ncbi:ribosomal RNA processing protein 36 homolog [Cydia amplana]|uniref:ribosomal RNA processing protein 36 homolog n=1 Tax=Cydia amplana TaxID=1869771 RepID=UPI002FE62816